MPERDVLQDAGAACERTGKLVVIVGPSGAGKDSLMDYAKARLAGDPALHFVRRAVTRQVDATAEDHDAMCAATFEAAAASGVFAVTWEAHGLKYGIPDTARAHTANGGIAVANGSRGALPAIRARFEDIAVVLVHAAPEVLAQRLSARGRETRADIVARLARSTYAFEHPVPDLRLDNSGELAAAGELLVAFLYRLAGQACGRNQSRDLRGSGLHI